MLCAASVYADKKFPTLPPPENYANSAAAFFFHYFICAPTHFDPAAGAQERHSLFLFSTGAPFGRGQSGSRFILGGEL